MPIDLRFQDSALGTEVNCNGVETGAASVGSRLIEYKPRPAKRDQKDQWQDVDETALVQYTTMALAESAVQSLNRYFEAARLAEARVMLHPGVFQRYRGDTSKTLYRSPVLNGYAHYEQTKLPARVRINWKRRYYMEQDAEAAVTWSDGTTTAKTVTINGASNVLQLQTSAIAGELEAPIRFSITNNYNNVVGVNDIHIGQLRGAASNWNGLLEAESAGGSINNAGTNSSDGTCSNGQYHTATAYSINAGWFTTLPDDPLYVMRRVWILSTSQLSAINGRKIKPFLRFRAAPAADIQVAFWLGYGAGGYSDQWIWRGDWQDAQQAAFDNFLEGNAFDVPYVALDAGQSVSGYTLGLAVRKATATDSTVQLDYVQLMPLDGYKRLDTLLSSAAYNEVVDESDIEPIAFARSGTSKRRQYRIDGRGVFVRPGENAWLYFQARDYSTSAIARTLSVLAYYRPRRLTL